MSRLGVLIALAGVTASAYAWAWYSDDAPYRAPDTPIADETVTTSATPPRDVRVFSAKDPLLATPHLANVEPTSIARDAVVVRHRTSTGTAKAAETPAPSPIAAMAPSKRLTSLKPGDADARAQLVRDIQYELRRVGCYDGEVHGSWNSGTKRAMKLFTDRVNAALPLDEPDYVLLTLVQNEQPGACGGGCPDGQFASERGQCLPRAIMAQRSKGIATPVSDQERPVAGGTSGGPQMPGRMGVGAPADEGVVPRLTLAPPHAPGDGAQAVGPAPADALNRRRSASSGKRAHPPIQRGSTRQVFSKLMQFAP